MSPQQSQPSCEPSTSSSGESKPSATNSIPENTQSEGPGLNDEPPELPQGADLKTIQEFFEKMCTWKIRHGEVCGHLQYCSPTFPTMFFWPLDTSKSLKAYSSEIGMPDHHWHAYAWIWYNHGISWGFAPRPNPPIQPLNDESILQPWNTYYNQLVSKKEDLFDRWITESMREMGLDPDNLTEDEENA